MTDRPSTFVNSWIAGLALPILFTLITGVIGGAFVGAVTWSSRNFIVWACILGGSGFAFWFRWWDRRLQALSQGEKVVRYEVVLWFNEWHGNSPTQKPMEIVGLTPLKIYNACVHLAGGKPFSYRAMMSIGYSDKDVALLQQRFIDERMGQWKDDEYHTQGFILTDLGERRVKLIAASPSPREDHSVWRRI